MTIELKKSVREDYDMFSGEIFFHRIQSFILATIFLLVLPLISRAEENQSFFYHNYGYGSDAMIHPLRLIINGGFGILQMDNRSNSLVDVDYHNGLDNIWWNLRNPFKTISEEGAYHFFRTQMFPFSFDEQEAYYWPNYTLHLVGGGMSFRMMEEWYRFRDFKHPKIFALLTITFYHVLNEVVENSDYTGYNSDAIADMYIFNPLGILLFSSNKVARFFSEKLNMSDWSYQPAYDPFTRSIQNHGQNFMMKYYLNEKKSVGIFYHFGTHGEIGLSFRRQDGQCISFGAGLVANELIDQSNREDFRELTADLVLTAGLFYDRNNSLLASLFYSKKLDYKLRLNVYPGLVRGFGLSPGFFIGLNQENKPNVGLTLSIIPVGISKGL